MTLVFSMLNHGFLSQAVLPFFLVALPLVLSPGPDTLLIMRNTLSSGKWVGLAAVLGVQLGLLVHTMLALIGLSVLILTYPQLHNALVIVGACYLGWLGIQGFRSQGLLQLEKGVSVSWQNSLVSAMLTNLLNPKALVLFFSLLPGFVRVQFQLPVHWQLLMLIMTLIITNTLWQSLLALFCDKASTWLFTPGVSKWLGYVCSVILLGFAVIMLYEHSW